MKSMKLLLTLALSSASLIAASSASAATYLFEITGPQSIKFALDSSPAPTVASLGEFFRIDGVTGVVNGMNSFFNLGFGSSTYASNFGFLNPTVGTQFIAAAGTQLYTGSESAPTFKTGTFALSDGYSVTIGAVPEPGTWAFMILGLAAVGATMRRQRKANVKVSYN